ncbi:MAG TPA: hypothetical protein ENI92_09040, partial [Bacteroidetes bacterium]|nr:hypothetical protein [Bacteroidota bacterium]
MARTVPGHESGASAQPGRPGLHDLHLGSTGEPKGTLCPHRSLVNLVLDQRVRFRFGPDDAIALNIPVSFDGSVYEIFMPLVSGGRLIIPKPDEHKEVAEFIELIKRRRVTSMVALHSMLVPLFSDPRIEECRSLRLLLSGGESLLPDLVRRIRQALPDMELFHVYGPTEAAVLV